MNSNKIKDECSDKEPCDYNNFKRGKYFHGMLMTDRDFTEEQRYHIEKRKLHNRMLHGWGVVCGLGMTKKDDNKSIIIDSGLALDCKGNEIFVCRKYELELSKLSKIRNSSSTQSSAGGCGPEIRTENKWYIVMRYCEKGTDQALVYAAATSECKGTVCNASRIQEGFCFDALRKEEICCPELLRKSGGICEETDNYEEIRKHFCDELLMGCPGECCANPQVVLGSFTLLNDNETMDKLDNWDCRKYVITFGLLQHWMTVLAPNHNIISFEKIVDYPLFGDACKDDHKAFETFCPNMADMKKPYEVTPTEIPSQNIQTKETKENRKTKSEKEKGRSKST